MCISLCLCFLYALKYVQTYSTLRPLLKQSQKLLLLLFNVQFMCLYLSLQPCHSRSQHFTRGTDNQAADIQQLEGNFPDPYISLGSEHSTTTVTLLVSYIPKYPRHERLVECSSFSLFADILAAVYSTYLLTSLTGGLPRMNTKEAYRTTELRRRRRCIFAKAFREK